MDPTKVKKISNQFSYLIPKFLVYLTKSEPYDLCHFVYIDYNDVIVIAFVTF